MYDDACGVAAATSLLLIMLMVGASLLLIILMMLYCQTFIWVLMLINDGNTLRQQVHCVGINDPRGPKRDECEIMNHGWRVPNEK